jgi:hypothetical protein
MELAHFDAVILIFGASFATVQLHAVSRFAVHITARD